MRIGIDATALYGNYGGVEYALWNLLCALQEVDLQHEYRVYIPGDGPDAGQVSGFSERWRWVRLPFRGAERARRIFWQQKVLSKQLTRDGCQVLHSPTYVLPLDIRIPSVLTVYDLIALTDPQFATTANRLHYRFMLPRSIKRAAKILVPSQAVADGIEQRFGRTDCKVVPLGVEPIFFQNHDSTALAQLRERHCLPERYLLYVGNFEPKKNLTTLLRALEKLPNAPPLVIAGGNRAWPGYAPKENSRVHPIGYLARHELPLLYAGCEAFVFPSLAEGFGLPVLEALASGAPVVTSTAVPLPELERCAVICDPHDAGSIAAGIAQVLSSRERQVRLREAGRQYAKPFTWHRAARETVAVYNLLRNTAQNCET